MEKKKKKKKGRVYKGGRKTPRSSPPFSGSAGVEADVRKTRNGKVRGKGIFKRKRKKKKIFLPSSLPAETVRIEKDLLNNGNQ